jgi:threonine synthase
VSSNFERCLFELSGRDADLVRAQMGSLAQSGSFRLSAAQLAGLATDFAAAAAFEPEVAEAIRHVRATAGYLMEPHTACGVVALDKTAPMPGVPQVVLATAHPAKFPDAMQAITGEWPALPARLSNLMQAPERFTRLPDDLAVVEAFVERHARAVRGIAA